MSDEIEVKVNELVSKVTKDDTGKLQFPEDADPALVVAARNEIRRRDTQSSYSKAEQRIKQLELENNQLASSWEQDAAHNLPSEEKARLDELKVQDPEAWRQEITKLEEQNKAKIKEKRETIKQETSKLSELDQRKVDLEEFAQNNPDLAINDDVIANDIPPRITKKLENGTISFKEYLEEVKSYLSKGKVVAKGDKPDATPDFAKSRGSATPSESAKKGQDKNDYSNEIF